MHKFKLVLLGESGVGKTSLALRFAKDRFNEQFDLSGNPETFISFVHTSTIGAGFFLPTFWVDDEQGQTKKVKLEIWDTAGQERFRSITPMYIRGAKAALVVYDTTDRGSFIQAQNWVDYLRNVQLTGLDNENLVIALVGNKLDLAEADRRDVEWREAQKYAAENDLIFIECSAKSSQNVHEAFCAIAQVLMRKEAQEVPKDPRANTNREFGGNLRGIVLNRVESVHNGTRQQVRNCCN